MTEINYKELGFKSGIEIHQQLDTKKLFCDCNSILRQDEHDFIIKRKLHPVAGESGEIDVAAAHQASLDKEFVYQGYNSNCLVELDEEPPHEINKDALKIAVQISLMLNARILPITQIMRKTVIDGSNTSGFQRTVVIAVDGFIETEKGKVGIESIALEEDSARLVERKDGVDTYRLDRLGIPLIEIVTSPDMKSPEQVKEVALAIGGILRSFKIKRGIGTIRQDVNLSIKNGNRVEIKGFQDPSMMVKTIDNEIKRHLKEKVKPEVRNALPDGSTKFLRPIPGAARMYPETDLPLLKIKKDFIDEAKKTMPKLKSEVEEDLKKTGLNHEMIGLLFKQDKLEEFKELVVTIGDANLVGKVLLILPTEIASKEKISSEEISKILNKYVLEYVLESVKKKKILESDIKHVLEQIVKGKDVQDAIKIEKEDKGNVEEKIMKIIESKPGLSSNAYMGLVMKEFKGKISGEEVMEIIKKYIK